MENKVLRLVIVRDLENNVLGFVALRSNGTTKYGFKESKENKKKYRLELLKEMFDAYPDGLEDYLNDKDIKGAIEHLKDEGYIIETTEDIITKITIHEEAEEPYFVVEYAIHEPETYNSKDFNNIEDYNQILDASKACVKADYRLGSEDSYEGLISHKEKVSVKLKRAIGELKIKNLKTTKRVLALVTAGVILVGTYSCGRKKGEESSNVPTSTTIETITPTSIPEAMPTVEPAILLEDEFPADEYWDFSEDYEYYDDYEDSTELFTIINSKGLEDQGRYTTNDVKDITTLNLEYFYEVMAANLGDLSYFATSGKKPLDYYRELTEAPRKTHFERIIPGLSSIDYEYIKYFSDLNIEVIDLGYCQNNAMEAKEINNRIVRDMVQYIINDQPLWLTVQGQEVAVSFSELSYEAQDAIRNICWGNYCLLGSDVVEFNGDYYNQALIGLDMFGIEQEPTSKR